MPLWRPAQYNRIPSTLPKKKKKAIKGAQLPERHQENGTLSFANGKVASGTFGHIFGLKSLNAEQVTIISNQDQKRFQSATVHLTQWTAVAERPKHNAIFPYLDQDQNIFPQITQKPWIRLKERKCDAPAYADAGIRETKFMPLAMKVTSTFDIQSFPRRKNGFICQEVWWQHSTTAWITFLWS